MLQFSCYTARRSDFVVRTVREQSEEGINIFCPNAEPEDNKSSFTPQKFDDYLGQSAVKNKIKLYVDAAKMRQEALDHVLLFGPPGLGKTTLSRIIAAELGVNCKVTSAPALEKVGDLVAILSSMQDREVLFIDEIHRLPKNIEESLYSAMESFFVDIIIGQGPGAKSMQLPLNKFTLVGATTKTGSLSGPLQTRFGISERLEFYEPEDLAKIVLQNAEKMQAKISNDATLEIGKRARGTPRIAKRLMRRVRDFAQVNKKEVIDLELTRQALDFLNVDESGLDALDQKIIRLLVKEFKGGPVGLDTLAAAAGEDKQTLQDFCEPYLIRCGLIQKTPKGRKISDSKQIRFDGNRVIISSEDEQLDIF